MSRRKRSWFIEPKMFSARIEKSDYDKVVQILDGENRTVQDFINECITLYISGSLRKTATGENQ